MPDLEPEENLEPEPEGLGGWLILVAIGLIMSPLLLVTVLWRDLLPIFVEGHWPLLTRPYSDAYHPLWAPLLVFEVLANLALVGFSLVCLFLFFRRSARFPTVVIAYYVANLGVVATDFFLATLIPAAAAMDDTESVKQLVRSIATCAIWIPYMRHSRRVLNTFVDHTSPSPGQSSAILPAA